MTRGQYIRLLIGTGSSNHLFVAAAKNLTLTVTANTEESSTKDTTGDWQEFEVTGLSYTITTTALVLDDEDELGYNSGTAEGFTLVNAEDYLNDTAKYWKIAYCSGTNNRTVGSVLCSGQCKFTSVEITGTNRQNATYQATLTGYGDLTIGS